MAKKKIKRDPNQPLLQGRDAHIARLKNGETVSFREGGNSMTPRIKSREKRTYAPVTSMEDVKIGDAVFCKVGGHFFTHLICAMRDETASHPARD